MSLEQPTKEEMNELVKGIIGHCKMCVRMKLRKDQKSKTKDPAVAQRVARGETALQWLQEVQKNYD